MIPWKLHATGKLFHSGLAHKVDSFMASSFKAISKVKVLVL